MSFTDSSVILQGEYVLYPKGKSALKVSVTKTSVSLTPNGKSSEKGMVMKIGDVIGSDTMKGKKADDTMSYLTIYSYPMKKKAVTRKLARKREAITLIFDKFSTYEENWKSASEWKVVLNCLARKMDLTNVQDLSTLRCDPRKRLLVLVNPFSGPGKALSMFQQRVVPILAEAGVHYHMVVTEHAGHAREMMKTVIIEDWHGIVIVSGDGLLYEVVNGLMDREDWETAIKIPVGALPGGSGNALSCALLHRLGEPYLSPDNHILSASYLLVKHDALPMDLVAVDTCAGKRMYSFLSVAWGIISDVDIESEKYRSMGDARFTLGALIRIIGLRKYPGRVSFLPCDSNYEPPKRHRESLRRTQSAYGYREQRHREVVRSQSTSDESPIHPVNTEPSVNGIAEEEAPVSPPPTSPPMSPTEGLVPTTPGPTDAQTSGFFPADNESSATSARSGQASTVPTPHLNPLDQPVPDDWVTIEDEFVFVAGVYLTHLSKDMIAAPESKLDDGHIFLLLCRSGITRLQMLGLFNDMETGKVAESSNVEMVRVKAFRIEPMTEKGIITVDGEAVDYGSLQAQVLPSMARIMTPAFL